MFDWIAPEKRRFFYILMAVLLVETWIVYCILQAEHRRFGPIVTLDDAIPDDYEKDIEQVDPQVEHAIGL